MHVFCNVVNIQWFFMKLYYFNAANLRKLVGPQLPNHLDPVTAVVFFGKNQVFYEYKSHFIAETVFLLENS